MTTRIAPDQAVQGVLSVLGGSPLNQAAADLGMEPVDLADAVALYRAAGHAALTAQAEEDWFQVRVQFPDWDTAEQTAAEHLAPAFRHVQDDGILGGWWFIRKAPCWRLRYQPAEASALPDLRAVVGALFDEHAVAGRIERWRESIYEPETLPFGGETAMGIGHDLFHADSHAILGYLHRHDQAAARSGKGTLGRRETSILLCGALFRGAHLEWHEQADVWHHVAQLRPLPPHTPAGPLRDLAADLERLITVATAPGGLLIGQDQRLAFLPPWTAAFEHAGRALGTAAAEGTLRRGLRAVLAHHVIFHWNRLGLPTKTQAILAHAARDALLNPPSSKPIPVPKRSNVACS